MSKQVTSYEIVDHGIDHEQYFTGCGVAFTDFENVATGCGSNPCEALEDALEMIAQQTDDVDLEDLERRILADEGEFPDSPDVEYHEDGESEEHYYLSIRYSL